MPNLSTLFPISEFAVTGQPDKLYVYNTSITSVSNGGQCCLWTVPAGVVWATFEVWGGGSSGPGGCCCQQPAQSGGAGAYARRTIPVIAGDTYRICAGGSTACIATCCGTCGFPSYVQTETATNTVNLCAAGGPTSCGQCFLQASGCVCIGNTRICTTGAFCGETIGFPNISGASHHETCGFNSWQYVPQGPFIGGGPRISRDYCLAGNGCNNLGGFAIWPSSGGGGAVSFGGSCCWGHWGAGGLVIVTYG